MSVVHKNAIVAPNATRSADNDSFHISDEVKSKPTSRHTSSPVAVVSSQHILAQLLGSGAASRRHVGDLGADMTVRMSEPVWDMLPGWLKPVVAHLIELCEASGKDPSMTPENHTQCDFECIQLPTVSIEYYAAVLFTSYPTMMLWLRALAALDRFLKNSGSDLNLYTVHRLLVTALHTTARYLGEEAPVPEHWGVAHADLELMGASFHLQVDGDYSITVENCISRLLPFSVASFESVLAVQLVLCETSSSRTKEEKIRAWVDRCEAPEGLLERTCRTSVGSDLQFDKNAMLEEQQGDERHTATAKGISLSSSLRGYISSIKSKLEKRSSR